MAVTGIAGAADRRTAGHPWMPFSRRGLAVLVPASVSLLILCVYRVLTFVPQPLDSPGTLRPVLYALFTRFVQHYASPEQAQTAWGTYCIIALLIPTVLVFWNYFYSGSGIRSSQWLHKAINSRLLLFSSIAACLMVCRFPFLLANELNPDETFFVAAAEKLFKDPVFFRAVDFTTSGPVNVYPLMLPAVFGVSPDYASSRIIALLIILAGIYAIYRALALLTTDSAARIAVLPAAGAFAVLKDQDLLHYSSEHVSFLLLTLSVYVCVRIFRRPQSHAWNLAWLGLLTAAAFLAKMQAVPILLGVAAVAFAYLHGGRHAGRWWRPSLLFGAGLLPLLLLNAIICVAAGVWHDFWMEYIVGNYNYVGSHGAMTSELQRFAEFALSSTDIRLSAASLFAILAIYVYYRKRWEPAADRLLFLEMGVIGGVTAVAANWVLRVASLSVGYAVIISILLVPGYFLLLYRQPAWNPRPITWFGFLSVVALALAVAVAYVPHRPFEHYLLLIVFPLAIVTAWFVVAATAEDSSTSRSPVPFLLIFAALILACRLLELGSPDLITFAAMPPTVRGPEGDLIDSLVPPKGQITVWGWNGRPYLGSARVSALKDLISAQLFLTQGEVRAYYRATYLRGLQRQRPDLFIDAVDISLSTFANRNIYGFEVIPEISSFIQSNYVHVMDTYGLRFYVRSDLARKASEVLAKRAPPSGYFMIVSKLSGKVLEIQGAHSRDNGSLIQQWGYVGGANQQWQLVPVDSQYDKIVSKLSNKVLEVQEGSGATANGAPIRQWDYSGGANQLWKLVPLDNTGYSIVSKLSGKALDIRGGAGATANAMPIQQWDYLGFPNQQWQLIPVQ